jgi:hypothetical protein
MRVAAERQLTGGAHAVGLERLSFTVLTRIVMFRCATAYDYYAARATGKKGFIEHVWNMTY